MLNKFSQRLLAFIFAFTIGMFPAIAYAHVIAGETSGFLHGLEHPIGGLDHILAMVAVGLWAAQLGGVATWAVPLAFVGVMTLGGVLCILGVPLPWVEQGIVASDLILGGLVLMATRLPLRVSIGIVGILALFHGYAHGAEMPKELSGLEYAAGFILATTGLHLLGMVAALTSKKFLKENLIRWAGGGVILGGIYLLMGSLTGN
ncbi:hydrogenase/urease accessory protein [Synechococcus sp. PCC 7502]|uniref:HupE/UreJ family protein n=1 Tax=Synechococcus sp. PCC 7502 TaxID=1173263 RepID=UPI00029FAC91|nr:HupE/UreJ family protein [Synechococcus sp. PCC 7502]AFY73193.1 hydrogenase/urease accessory protein [Synechococcus sp. PCC 7502]